MLHNVVFKMLITGYPMRHVSNCICIAFRPITLTVAKCWDPTPKGYFTLPPSKFKWLLINYLQFSYFFKIGLTTSLVLFVYLHLRLLWRNASVSCLVTLNHSSLNDWRVVLYFLNPLNPEINIQGSSGQPPLLVERTWLRSTGLSLYSFDDHYL